MSVFFTTLDQTAHLLLFIVIGYFLMKLKLVPDVSHSVLAQLEKYLFIPALVMGTFMNNFTVNKLTDAGRYFIAGIILEAVTVALSLIFIRLCSRDKYEQSICLYGLAFANFGYMGNAVVNAVFPEHFDVYVIFTIPMWILIYVWGVPSLLIGDSGHRTFKERLRNIANPMFVGMAAGILIGLTGVRMPAFVKAAVASAGGCMSPVAMLITGMIAAKFDLRQILKGFSVYAVTFFRLAVFPALFLILLCFIELPEVIALCSVCVLSMPLGLNSIIIPGAYGKDTKVAAGMALVSHVLSCVTIPVVFMLYELIC